MGLPRPHALWDVKIQMQAQGVDGTQLEMFLSQLLSTSPNPPHSLRSARGIGHVSALCIAKSAKAFRALLIAVKISFKGCSSALFYS